MRSAIQRAESQTGIPEEIWGERKKMRIGGALHVPTPPAFVAKRQTRDVPRIPPAQRVMEGEESERMGFRGLGVGTCSEKNEDREFNQQRGGPKEKQTEEEKRTETKQKNPIREDREKREEEKGTEKETGPETKKEERKPEQKEDQRKQPKEEATRCPGRSGGHR